MEAQNSAKSLKDVDGMSASADLMVVSEFSKVM
jgi:hypothetical protein